MPIHALGSPLAGRVLPILAAVDFSDAAFVTEPIMHNLKGVASRACGDEDVAKISCQFRRAFQPFLENLMISLSMFLLA